MNRFKATALLIVAAIANPLCCCLGVDALLELVLADQEEAAAHSCCSMVQSATEQSESCATSSDEPCPHDLQRTSKILDGDAAQTHLKPNLGCLVGFLPDAVSGASLHRTDEKFAQRQTRPVAFADPSIPQTHCVYLL